MRPSRLIVGITGASGAVYGVRLLERARALGVQTHLVATPAASSTCTTNWAWTARLWRPAATEAHAPR